jgi:hypothetical protein
VTNCVLVCHAYEVNYIETTEDDMEIAVGVRSHRSYNCVTNAKLTIDPFDEHAS